MTCAILARIIIFLRLLKKKPKPSACIAYCQQYEQQNRYGLPICKH